MSRVQIGSRYEGQPWDRPALRRMPEGWVLEETRPEKHRGDQAVALVVVCLLAFIITKGFIEWLFP